MLKVIRFLRQPLTAVHDRDSIMGRASNLVSWVCLYSTIDRVFVYVCVYILSIQKNIQKLTKRADRQQKLCHITHSLTLSSSRERISCLHVLLVLKHKMYQNRQPAANVGKVNVVVLLLAFCKLVIMTEQAFDKAYPALILNLNLMFTQPHWRQRAQMRVRVDIVRENDSGRVRARKMSEWELDLPTGITMQKRVPLCSTHKIRLSRSFSIDASNLLNCVFKFAKTIAFRQNFTITGFMIEYFLRTMHNVNSNNNLRQLSD